MGKWKGADYIPKELVDLQVELSRYEHRHIRDKIEAEGFTTFSETIGAVAAEVGVLLDGYYTEEDLQGLCKTLVQKLRDKRSPIYLGNQ